MLMMMQVGVSKLQHQHFIESARLLRRLAASLALLGKLLRLLPKLWLCARKNWDKIPNFVQRSWDDGHDEPSSVRIRRTQRTDMGTC
jgi:hypothetical protein